MMLRLTLAIVMGAIILGVGAVMLLPRDPGQEAGAAVSAVDLLASPAAGFARVLGPRPFVFPIDHGPHREFRTEWWYYTGNLATATDRHFGYQLTFFRVGLAADGKPRASRWATTEAWMAHFAVTDVAGGRFLTRSRLARGSLGLAGARRLRVWLEDWSVEGTEGPGARPGMRLSAADGDLSLDLTLRSLKPPTLQGERGYSRKSATPGNASYYYSLTRLDTRGQVRIGDLRGEVSGTSWMDREWSTSALDSGQVGWDWFALQLDDGRDLMFYRLRRADGSADPFSAGSLVLRDGTTATLGASDVAVDVLDWWTSPATTARYPARWRVDVPSAGLALEVTPRIADQEWTQPLRYWEGSVAVHGTANGRRVGGDGYVELVGYSGGVPRNGLPARRESRRPASRHSETPLPDRAG